MKTSSIAMLVLLLAFIICLFGSDILLKIQFNRIDKTDPYWNYAKLQQGTFHHLKITGGNVTKISFTPGPHGLIGVLNYWERDMDGRVKAGIALDTLFLYIEKRTENPGTRDWMKRRALISISCPDLLSVDATNTDLSLYKLKQKNLTVNLSGTSRLEVESYVPDFDSLDVQQKDSSEAVFEMADEIRSSGTMHIRSLEARLQGHSLLDVGHFQIQSLHQTISDTAAIILSGYTLKQMKY
jgi:hypothetical protein